MDGAVPVQVLQAEGDASDDVECHARKFTSNFRTYLCIKSSSRNQPRYTN
jgi:hypothetical protein